MGMISWDNLIGNYITGKDNRVGKYNIYNVKKKERKFDERKLKQKQ